MLPGYLALHPATADKFQSRAASLMRERGALLRDSGFSF
jgi:hypothetical protein